MDYTRDTPATPKPQMSMREVKLPFLRILYHGDLSRIGEATPPALLFRDDAEMLVGRQTPDFIDPTQPFARPRPLEDTHVSRKQFTVKWVPEEGTFEVSPVSGARRKLSYVDLARDKAEPVLYDIVEPMRLPPGSLIAVGKRVVMRLCLDRYYPHTHDRMGLIGETGSMWALREEIGSMAQFQRPALVLGETGSGKELVARALHEHSPRSAGPFVALNCAALPEHLVESELFGYVKGAFTGAQSDKKGLFDAAHGGTLFLDEFGELPLAIQAKMLRTMQEGLVTPVGSHESNSVDVRLIAATNRDPDEEVREGRLRTDLYYRIAAHELRVPRLAARCWDVPMLFVHFLAVLKGEHPTLSWLWHSPAPPTPAIPMTFFLALMRHDWPGNVRELQNIIEQTARLNLEPGTFRTPARLRSAPTHESMPTRAKLARVTSESRRTISSHMATEWMRMACQELGVVPKTANKLLKPGDLGGAEVDTAPHNFQAFVEELRVVLGKNLFDLLDEQDFNQSRVAKFLGVSRTTIQRLIRGFGLPRVVDIGLPELQAAYAVSNHDMDAMARSLRVSPRALRVHLTRSGLMEALDKGEA